jgi:hypothetical protein
MNVKDKFIENPEHSIEWGISIWDSAVISIRNRYDNPITKKFNKQGSSEISWEDFKLMVKHSILKRQLTSSELADILRDISSVI